MKHLKTLLDGLKSDSSYSSGYQDRDGKVWYRRRLKWARDDRNVEVLLETS